MSMDHSAETEVDPGDLETLVDLQKTLKSSHLEGQSHVLFDSDGVLKALERTVCCSVHISTVLTNVKRFIRL